MKGLHELSRTDQEAEDFKKFMDFADDAPYPTEVLNIYLKLLKSIDMPFKELLGVEAST